MPLNDVRQVKNPIMWRQRSITASNQLKFPSTQNARFHQLTKMYTTFNRFESPLIV